MPTADSIYSADSNNLLSWNGTSWCDVWARSLWSL